MAEKINEAIADVSTALLDPCAPVDFDGVIVPGFLPVLLYVAIAYLSRTEEKSAKKAFMTWVLLKTRKSRSSSETVPSVSNFRYSKKLNILIRGYASRKDEFVIVCLHLELIQNLPGLLDC